MPDCNIDDRTVNDPLRGKTREHLNLDDSHKSAVENRLRSCHQCCNLVNNVTFFKILRKCITDYDTQIHEAVLIKKLRPQLKKRLSGLICFKDSCLNAIVSSQWKIL